MIVNDGVEKKSWDLSFLDGSESPHVRNKSTPGSCRGVGSSMCFQSGPRTPMSFLEARFMEEPAFSEEYGQRLYDEIKRQRKMNMNDERSKLDACENNSKSIFSVNNVSRASSQTKVLGQKSTILSEELSDKTESGAFQGVINSPTFHNKEESKKILIADSLQQSEAAEPHFYVNSDDGDMKADYSPAENECRNHEITLDSSDRTAKYNVSVTKSSHFNVHNMVGIKSQQTSRIENCGKVPQTNTSEHLDKISCNLFLFSGATSQNKAHDVKESENSSRTSSNHNPTSSSAIVKASCSFNLPRDPNSCSTATDNKCPLYTRSVVSLFDWELAILKTTYSRLEHCGFYHRAMNLEEAGKLLAGFPVGTFLLRDSSDSRFVFSLSIVTNRGPTSIRIIFSSGKFRLDCDDSQSPIIPAFDCVLALIRHYVLQSRDTMRRIKTNWKFQYVFLERSGRQDTPVLMLNALRTEPFSLLHLCRLRINGLMAGQSVDRLCLSPSLKKYLNEYPYDV